MGHPRKHRPGAALYTVVMFARKIRVEYIPDGVATPAPIHWLDNFAMRSFTNDSVFDDTLPVADGLLEIGCARPPRSARRPPHRLVPPQGLSHRDRLACASPNWNPGRDDRSNGAAMSCLTFPPSCSGAR